MKDSKKKGRFSILKKGVFSVVVACMMACPLLCVGCNKTEAKDGALWYTGTDVSEFNGKGKLGDFFYDTDDGVVYQKTTTGWVKLSVIKGKDGVTPTIDINQDGYWVINGNVTSHQSENIPYINEETGTWWIDGEDTTISAVGPDGKSAYDIALEQGFVGTEAEWLESLKGEKGDTGNPGKDGAKWITGLVNPVNSIGENGDLYLNTLTYDLFIKKGGSWGKPICNIKGESGDDGEDRVLVSRSSTANNELVITEDGIDLHSLNLADETNKTTIYGPNRLNLAETTFTKSGYSALHNVEKTETGIVINAGEISTAGNVAVEYKYTAEFTGKLYLSCDAGLLELEEGGYGASSDIGIRMICADRDTGVLKNAGKITASIDVEKGEEVKLMFYAKINSKAKNKIQYNNIMLQYDKVTEYVPFGDIVNYKGAIAEFNISEFAKNLTDGELKSVFAGSTTKTNDSSIRLAISVTLDELGINYGDIAPGVLTEQNKIANIEISSNDENLKLISYQDVYNENYGLGIRDRKTNSNGSIDEARIIIYIGEGKTSDELRQYVKDSQLVIWYETNTEEFTGFSDIQIHTGSRIVSEGAFTIKYSYQA